MLDGTKSVRQYLRSMPTVKPPHPLKRSIALSCCLGCGPGMMGSTSKWSLWFGRILTLRSECLSVDGVRFELFLRLALRGVSPLDVEAVLLVPVLVRLRHRLVQAHGALTLGVLVRFHTKYMIHEFS